MKKIKIFLIKRLLKEIKSFNNNDDDILFLKLASSAILDKKIINNNDILRLITRCLDYRLRIGNFTFVQVKAIERLQNG
ncbi:MAG: hypothetical protein GY756_09985 [bacterium]|nr:hypothetical protein [bacterium]